MNQFSNILIATGDHCEFDQSNECNNENLQINIELNKKSTKNKHDSVHKGSVQINEDKNNNKIVGRSIQYF